MCVCGAGGGLPESVAGRDAIAYGPQGSGTRASLAAEAAEGGPSGAYMVGGARRRSRHRATRRKGRRAARRSKNRNTQRNRVRLNIRAQIRLSQRH